MNNVISGIIYYIDTLLMLSISTDRLFIAMFDDCTQ